ncbi:TetR/AcrR family transcriptional regulator [Kordiimonas pumila]|uniref:TetR/AcrR family transcriptional regulator n=1 Tax=Kordiimonas pumila TaxID=2161677 RepID=A0ABV7D8H7_9PROT|nr:TetR/AcrR family transcriptional regulator [Kordiimonas pumila]
MAPLKKSSATEPKAKRRSPVARRSAGKPRRADLTKIALIEAAERLIAKKGLANVTTRAILDEAGQKNQSALQYHFGSKDGLIGATINERTRQIDKVRLTMLESMPDEPSLRQIYQALVYPLRDLIKNDAAGKNYLSFLAQAATRPSWELRKIIRDFDITGMERCYEHYDKLLCHLSEEERLLKQNAAFDITILTLKRWCMTPKKKAMSLEQITEFLVDTSLAIIAA